MKRALKKQNLSLKVWNPYMSHYKQNQPWPPLFLSPGKGFGGRIWKMEIPGHRLDEEASFQPKMWEKIWRHWVSVAFNLSKENKDFLRLCFVTWLLSQQLPTTDFQRKEDLAITFLHLCLVSSGHPWPPGPGQSDGYSRIASDMKVTGHCLPFLCSLEWSAYFFFSVL